MVAPFTYKEKFLSSLLFLGLLDYDKEEIKHYDYQRILINPNLFSQVSKNNYVNKHAFGFRESFSDWGKVYYVGAFYLDKLISFDYQGEKRVTKFTTVIFRISDAKIEFCE